MARSIQSTQRGYWPIVIERPPSSSLSVSRTVSTSGCAWASCGSYALSKLRSYRSIKYLQESAAEDQHLKVILNAKILGNKEAAFDSHVTYLLESSKVFKIVGFQNRHEFFRPNTRKEWRKNGLQVRKSVLGKNRTQELRLVVERRIVSFTDKASGSGRQGLTVSTDSQPNNHCFRNRMMPPKHDTTHLLLMAHE